jgi:RNA polymerase sigma factor (sigma-70 family)
MPPSTPDSITQAHEDELLVVRCQLGERAAFDELIRRWDEPLWRYACRLTDRGDTARDITQDVWVKVLRGIGRLRDGTKLRAWLFGITRRTLMDRLREQYARPIQSAIDVAELASDLTSDELETDLAALHFGLGRLPVVEREVLTLFYLEELSLNEVSVVIGVPLGTVKSRLFRARQLLRRELVIAEES